MKIRQLFMTICAASYLAVLAMPSAQAAAVSANFDGIDSENGFERFYVTASGNDLNDQPVSMQTIFDGLSIPPSPLMSSLNRDGTEDEEGLITDHMQFSISLSDDPAVGGDAELVDFTYTQNPGDPGLRYVVTKSDGGFRFHFWDADGDGTPDLVNSGQVRTFLNEPLDFGDSVSQPLAELSHISFYDTTEVPVPATLLLFGIGLIGLGLGLRSRQQ